MIDLDYFPAFSTPKIPTHVEANLPAGLSSVPSYWYVLAAPVAPDKGMPHFRDVTFENIHADGAGEAFNVNAAPDAPLENFMWKNIDLEAQHAGAVRHTLSWNLENVQVRASDGAPIILEDMRETTGSVRQLH